MFTRLTAWARTLRVPSAAELARMTDEEAFKVYRTSRRERARAAVLAEMADRDREDQKRASRERARAKREAQRDAYALYVYNAWIAAESDCRGYLLSKAGKAAGVEPADLWPMAESRAMRYASEELRDWWHDHGRMTFRHFEQHSREQRPELAVAL